jgi:TetR/AcrR family transcriptional regulator
MGITERKEREKEQRRNDIIDAAEKVLFSKGYDNATMEDVAEEAELSKATLYLYFKSKEDLHFAICARALQILMGMFQKAVSKNKSAFENLVEVGKAYVKFAQKHPDYFRSIIYFEGKDFSEMNCNECLLGNTDKCPLMFLIKLIEKGHNDKSVKSSVSPEIMGHLLWAQTTGALQMANTRKCIVFRDKMNIEDIVSGHFKILKSGIKKK